MLIKFLDKLFTLNMQKVLFKSFRSGFLIYNATNVFLFIMFYFLDKKLHFFTNIFFIINFIYILVIILLYLNVKYYNKIIKNKISYIIDCIEKGNATFKCKYDFKSFSHKYCKNKTYKIEKYNDPYFIINHENSDIEFMNIENYINKFDFDSIKEKRKLKLKKLNEKW